MTGTIFLSKLNLYLTAEPFLCASACTSIARDRVYIYLQTLLVPLNLVVCNSRHKKKEANGGEKMHVMSCVARVPLHLGMPVQVALAAPS